MTPTELLVNIIFSTGSMIGFFYIYKKTHYSAALLAGTLSYIELIYRTFMANIPLIAYGLDLMIIPEALVMIYFIIIIWKDGFKWIPLMLMTLFTNYLLLASIGHTFYGEIGTGFMLILLVWVSQSTHPCNINPWECKKCK